MVSSDKVEVACAWAILVLHTKYKAVSTLCREEKAARVEHRNSSFGLYMYMVYITSGCCQEAS